MSVSLIIGHVLTEAHSLVSLLFPESANMEVNWFWQKIDFKINILWWIKLITDDLLWCIVFFVMALIAKQYSLRLYFIVSVYFFYHVIDLFLFMYNYKQTTLVYWGLLGATIISTIALIWPIKATGKYKSLI